MENINSTHIVEYLTKKIKIDCVWGDITRMQVDVVVNAANSSLMGGGGVDGAIHRAGGPAILEECKQIRKTLPDGLPTGEAVLTTAGKLEARALIHTVGPIWKNGKNQEGILLKHCYENCLRIANENMFTSIAFPAISTGIYGFPKDLACKIALTTLSEFLQQPNSIKEVYFVCFDEETYKIYLDQMDKEFGQ